MIAYINPAAIPALTVAGIFFLIVNSLAGVWLVRHRRELFGADNRVEGDRTATRYLAVMVLCIPLLFLTIRLVIELIGLLIKGSSAG
jgi:hypothetical protein